MSFPTNLDNIPQPGSGDITTSPSHAGTHDLEITAIQAVEAKVGIGASTPVASTLLRGTGTGTSAYAQAVLTTDVTGTLPVANGGIGQTSLTNLPLTTPVISSITNSGTITLPTSNDTLVGRATTDTLTNKTITSSTNSVSAVTFTNPYKFSVYRSAALNSPNAVQSVVPFDTKSNDTSSNVDIVTNQGRFTAPVAGFYFFSARMSIATSARIFASIFKNGSEVKRGDDSPSGTPIGTTISGLVQLAASDYIEVYIFTSAVCAYEVGSARAYFDGYLVSVT